LHSEWKERYFDDLFLNARLEIFLRYLLDWGSEVKRYFTHGGDQWFFDEVEPASVDEYL
jgi:hypothetical protein